MRPGLRRVLVIAAVLVSAPFDAVLAADGQDAMDEVRQLLEAGKLEDAQALALEHARSGDPRAQETLASMLLRGVGSAPDREAGMGWLCLRVHAPEGGRAVAQALWMLAEYYRTGGGLPGRHYKDGKRSLEDPVKAYFWFGLMAGQHRYYRETVAEAEKLGRLGVSTLARQLTVGERQTTQRRLETWSPDQVPESAARCLELPRS